MELGFETIGNAILIFYDKKPILTTDPWISDSAYFGSWGHSHKIPDEQREAIELSKYIWLSHGHPDHLDSKSLRGLSKKKILLPDHVGSRIAYDMKEQGFDIHVLSDKKWYPLSDRIKVLCIADCNQDAILLVDIGGKLVFNKNDANDNGWESYVRKVVKTYDQSFLLALSSRFGDADMINFFDEDGNRIPRTENTPKLGQRNAWRTEDIGAKFFIPFSSMHCFQRRDSIWANELHTSINDYADGFQSKTAECLSAYIRYDCLNDRVEKINPAENQIQVREPGEFGDHWDELLEPDDIKKATVYFSKIEHLHTVVDFINLRVGGRNNHIKISDRKSTKGITFEAPRGSLMTAINYEIFDDMLIGNFMKTTLHGDWDAHGLYPDFTPYVAKYSDNGQAKTKDELKEYMAAYRRRMPIGWLKKQFESQAENIFRSWVPEEGILYKSAKKLYWYYKRSLR
ncbi:MBL fold metallo-hydrolase [Candidatus Nitrosacidococcus tergens]|uniref:MBL fold metallo-hydrolase n=1 Tax=Candidatus Nitrosacidococcus tergens TaxID=553981 RepID=A0A7G1QBF7_9GAMM|nr:MBL fold metallo-hydrolase [Candidatus Nitrosacidococcus tergens]CAB1277177.1 conserved protein of unknown function [Candidatus Nitrosacidococcus tergens]